MLLFFTTAGCIFFGILSLVLGITLTNRDGNLLNFTEWAESYFRNQPGTLKDLKGAIAKHFHIYGDGV